jgi:hypothetical protein
MARAHFRGERRAGSRPDVRLECAGRMSTIRSTMVDRDDVPVSRGDDDAVVLGTTRSVEISGDQSTVRRHPDGVPEDRRESVSDTRIYDSASGWQESCLLLWVNFVAPPGFSVTCRCPVEEASARTATSSHKIIMREALKGECVLRNCLSNAEKSCLS